MPFVALVSMVTDAMKRVHRTAKIGANKTQEYALAVKQVIKYIYLYLDTSLLYIYTNL